MSDSKFNSLLSVLVPQIIREIVNNENISEDIAIQKFYGSVLYSKLEQEETKLWHLSPKALYNLYYQEQTKGFITYPEEN